MTAASGGCYGPGMPRSEATPMAAATDATLVLRIGSLPAGAAHEEEAELYRRFAPRVRLYGLKYLREEAAAQDLVQQVFLVAIERLRGREVRNPDAIGSFILGTSRTIAGALRKTDDRRRALTERFEDRTATESQSPDALDIPRMERCLETLAVRDRMVLVLTFYAEKAAPEIASELGLAPGAVRVARHRALMRLRDCVRSGRT